MTQETSSVHSSDAILAVIAQLRMKVAYLEKRCRELEGMAGKNSQNSINPHRLMVAKGPIKTMTLRMVALSGKILTCLTNHQSLNLKASGSLQVKKLEAKRDKREAVLNLSITLTMLSVTPFRNISIAMPLCLMSSRPGIL